MTCPSCGAPVGPGARFCAYCGASVGTAAPPAAAPLPSTPGPIPYAPGPYSFPAPPPQHHRSKVVIVVVIVIVIGLIGTAIAFEVLVPPPPAVVVGTIDIWAPDNVCGLNTTQIDYPGYNSSTGQAIALELSVPNYNASACIVHGVRTNSSGFALSQVQTGVRIPASGNATLNLTVTSPGSSFSGNLDLVFS